MERNWTKTLKTGLLLLGAFLLWTVCVQTVDVRPVGQLDTRVGFAALNTWFHQRTGVHMAVYTLTDWLGLVPMAVCAAFGCLGLWQLIRRKSLFKVDPDILLLGIYYIAVIACYVLFEMIPINFRPVLIEGRLETSYPSSTTLLVLSVMPTLAFQANRRVKNPALRSVLTWFAALFALFMVAGRTLAGVHWLTDIVGAVLFSAGAYLVYQSAVLWADFTFSRRKPPFPNR